MREIRPSGSEGGVGLIPHPYPYRPVDGLGLIINSPWFCNWFFLV